jgi:hypothetical protein
MMPHREPWRENSLSTALLIVAALMLGYVAVWVWYLRTSSPQPPVETRLEAPAQPCAAGS